MLGVCTVMAAPDARADRGRACERAGAYPKILLSSPLPSMYRSSESRKSSMDGTGARDPALACSGWYAVTSSFDETRWRSPVRTYHVSQVYKCAGRDVRASAEGA